MIVYYYFSECFGFGVQIGNTAETGALQAGSDLRVKAIGGQIVDHEWFHCVST